MSYYQILDRPEGTYPFKQSPGTQLSGISRAGARGVKDLMFRKAAERAQLTPEWTTDEAGNIKMTYKKPEPFDASEILDTLKLKTVLDKLSQQGEKSPAEAISSALDAEYTPPVTPAVPKAAPEAIAPKVEPTPVSAEAKPPQFIKIQEGEDEFGLPKYKTVKNPDYEMWVSKQAGEIKAKGTERGEEIKHQRYFRQVTNMFKGIIAQIKGQEEEQQGLGLGPGIKGQAHVLLKDPEYSRTASAYGQRVETALRMNSILTGQNRVIRSVVNMIEKSIPQAFDSSTTVAAKTAQTVTNAYIITRVFQKKGLTPEAISKMSQEELDAIDAERLVEAYTLTPAEERELETIIKDVLATPPVKKRDLLGPRGKGITQNFSSVEEAEAANLPKGTIITIQGRKAVVE